MEQQTERTRQHAEIFTPLWICKQMNDDADIGWFHKKNPHPFDSSDKVTFLAAKKWWYYVDARRLEITCGEAPYLVSRYDVSTGESIPLKDRIGLLDRKLRVVNENAANEKEWMKWTIRAFQSIYGYEFQGDNLLIARVNLLMTFEEYLQERWGRKPNDKEWRTVANIIAWNIWQMDGLTGTIPYCKAPEEVVQLSIYDCFEGLGQMMDEQENKQPHCRIFDWRRDGSLEFLRINEGGTRKMKFDFVIGNPPYQEDYNGNSNGANPIYHLFIDSARKVSSKGKFIHPARFLFNVGKTPKHWNQKMLHDKHFKIVNYWASSADVFPSNVDIKGGVVISCWDEDLDFGEIGIFTAFQELNTIIRKVLSTNFLPFSNVVSPVGIYRLTDELYAENPWALDRPSKGHKFDVTSNVFTVFPELFFEEKPADDEYIQIFGRANNVRCLKWIKKKYVKVPDSFNDYKLFIPKANGSGVFGESLSSPEIGEPGVGHTFTFLSIGGFDSRYEAEAVVHYLATKFARTMLGTLKPTQDNLRDTWANVPLQDFTPSSDIDWTRSIAEVDQQLYAKYGLDEKEIAFIESHVKEMS